MDDCHGRLRWPQRGVYFFFEEKEMRSSSGHGHRIVRVGTHALAASSRASLWNRLSQHRGIMRTGGGNHRGSIFRLLIGTAIVARDGQKAPSSWGMGSDPAKVATEMQVSRIALLEQEHPLEGAVTACIGRMSIVWLEINDAAGPDSNRGFIERNSIALLSNFRRVDKLDPSSRAWLGRHCSRERVRLSGLWNNNHVDEAYDPQFLTVLENLI
jgi:hypothetical protein